MKNKKKTLVIIDDDAAHCSSKNRSVIFSDEVKFNYNICLFENRRALRPVCKPQVFLKWEEWIES